MADNAPEPDETEGEAAATDAQEAFDAVMKNAEEHPVEE